MQMGIHSFPARRWGRIGLVALLGLTLALVTVSASHASTSSWLKAGATAAKKKCKKKKHRSAAVAKKKWKKKKKAAPPAVTPPRGPIERIVVTWFGDADIDAHAWSSGLHDGWNDLLGLNEAEIPGTTYEPSGGGSPAGNRERIIEQNPNPTIRPMTFGLCYYAGLGSTDDGPTDITVTTVFSNGQSSTQSFPVDYGDALINNNHEGGAPDPAGDWCPSPF